MTTNTQILQTLKTIEGSGSFQKSGVKNFVPPGLHVEGLGEIAFPLNPIMAKALVDEAIKAPFGKGSQTVTDTNVRSAWEIDAQKVSFRNEDWATFIDEVLAQVREGLGVENQTIAANLYKLLIYEEGDFFLPHKDSEKEKGMFATLIISLPSEHTGGELVIQFEGQEEVIDFSGATSNYKLPYVAFYADCEHEVKPVTSGYRVNLVYNLVQKKGNAIRSPKFTDQVDELTGLIRSLETSFEHRPKAILLGHQYTPTNYSLDQLKHHDWPRAKALLEAAEKAGFFAKLGLLTHYRMGDLEGGGYYDDYYSRRRGRYSYYDEEEEEEETSNEGTMGDIHETYSHLEHWSKDSGPTLGDIHLEESDIIREIELGDGEPMEQEQEGYTGNAGMTIEYWYHYGAVILWPKSKHANLLYSQPAPKRLGWLDYYTANWENEALNSKDYAQQLLVGLKPQKEEEQPAYYSYYRRNLADYSPVAKALLKLDDTAFLRKNGLPILVDSFEFISVIDWTALLHYYTPENFSAAFQQAGQKDDKKVTRHLLMILEKLMESSASAVTKFAVGQIQQLPTYLSNVALHTLNQQHDYADGSTISDATITIDIVEKVIALSEHNEIDTKWINALAATITQNLARPYANEVLVPVLLAQKSADSKLANLLFEIVCADLVKRTKIKPTPPDNWIRPLPKAESYYQDKLELLRSFMQSPTQKVFDYVKNESYRKAMASAINSVTIDLRMETIRRGRPYTLRLTKTQAAYELALKHWYEDVKLLEKLEREW
ncbi:MAG: 2OG-Fe(II) oxygenase [Bacteroidota bacterium]